MKQGQCGSGCFRRCNGEVLVLTLAALLTACNAGKSSQEQSRAEAKEMNDFAEAAASVLRPSPKVKSFKDGVALTINVYPLWIGEGEPPSDLRLQFTDGWLTQSTGELNSIWFVEGADNFRRVFTTDEVIYKRPPSIAQGDRKDMIKTLQSLVPLHSETFAVLPDTNIESIYVKVYDRDRWGSDQKTAELTAFLSQLGKGSQHFNPGHEEDIPVISDLLRLVVFDLPNLAMENESLGQFKLVINGQNGDIKLHDGWFVSGYTAFEVIANSFSDVANQNIQPVTQADGGREGHASAPGTVPTEFAPPAVDARPK